MHHLIQRGLRLLLSLMIVLLASGLSPTYTKAADSELITKGTTEEKLIALTFNDNTYGTYITPILNALAAENVKATFFVTGRGLEQHPQLIKQIDAQGHQIGNLSYTPKDFTTLTPEQMKDELDRTDALVQQVIGKSTKPYFRAPFSAINNTVLTEVGNAGYTKTIQGNIGTSDWKGLPAADIVNTVITKAVPGSIVIMHCSGGAVNTAAALPEMITKLKADGYKFVTVDQLLNPQSEPPPPPPPPPLPPSEFIMKGTTEEKLIALTFDDDTYGTYVHPILDVLAAENVKATFFVTGSGVVKRPQDMKDILSQGHQLANHSYSHPDFTTLTAEQIKDEIERTEAAVQEATGTTMKPYFRAPFGAVNDAVLAAVGAAGYAKTVHWDIGTADWKGIPASEIVNTVLTKAVPGSIVLMHCTGGAVNVPEALPDMISQLRDQGYKFVTVAELLDPKPEPPPPPPPPPTPSELVLKGTTSAKRIALTFNDNTYGTYVTPVLEALAKENVKATFFVTGRGVEQHPQLIKQMNAQGHQIGNLSYSPKDFTTLTPEQMKDELDRTDALVKQAIGKSTKPYFRAPFGAVNNTVLNEVGYAGYAKTIQWNIGTGDWKGIPASDIVNTVVSQAVPGSIVVMHCSGGAVNTPAALPEMIAQLKAQGYEFVTVDQLLNESTK